MKKTVHLILLTLGIAALSGCGARDSDNPPTKSIKPVVYSDWSAPVNLGAAVNTSANDQHPAVSTDGLSLYFASDRPGLVNGSVAGSLDLWVSHRVSLDAPWGTPVNLGSIVNSSQTDFAPNLSSDGHTLYFGSERSGGCGMRDVWASYRLDNTVDDGPNGWQTPVDLGCHLNSAVWDDGPCFFQDAKTGVVTMYLTSQNRPGGLGDFDIWASTLQPDGNWSDAVNVTELNSTSRDTRTAVRSDGLEIYLTSMRPGSVPDGTGAPSLDLWASTRVSTSDPWGAPVVMSSPINGPYADGAPALSPDATELYFYSNRLGGSGLNDLYVARRTVITP